VATWKSYGPYSRPTPNPPWASNEPSPPPDEDMDPAACEHRCLRCRAPIVHLGLCEACFFPFWEKRLQAQEGAWLVRDTPKVWTNRVYRDIGALREWA
jgi:hypothetical protein